MKVPLDRVGTRVRNAMPDGDERQQGPDSPPAPVDGYAETDERAVEHQQRDDLPRQERRRK